MWFLGVKLMGLVLWEFQNPVDIRGSCGAPCVSEQRQCHVSLPGQSQSPLDMNGPSRIPLWAVMCSQFSQGGYHPLVTRLPWLWLALGALPGEEAPGAALLRLFAGACSGLIAAVLSELSAFLLLRRLWKESCTTEQARSATAAVLEAEA